MTWPLPALQERLQVGRDVEGLDGRKVQSPRLAPAKKLQHGPVVGFTRVLVSDVVGEEPLPSVVPYLGHDGRHHVNP